MSIYKRDKIKLDQEKITNAISDDDKLKLGEIIANIAASSPMAQPGEKSDFYDNEYGYTCNLMRLVRHVA